MLIKNLFWINLILVGFITAQSVIKINNLQKKDGLYYQPRDSNPYTGRIIDVNENGDINLEGKFSRGKRNGIWTTWYVNGQKEHEGYYKNGLKSGLWKTWYDSGQAWKEGYYYAGKKEGGWLYWYWNGNNLEVETYRNGILHGPWKKWYSNGQQKIEGSYKDITQDGVSRKYGKWIYYLNDSGTSRIAKYYGND